MQAIARVEPLMTARGVRGPFDYALPEAMRGAVAVGSVLMVPFGRRRVLGVVTELASTSAIAPERLAEPIESLEAGVPPRLVELALWVADQYCSTPARGLALVTPPGTGTGSAAGRTRAKRALYANLTAAGVAAAGNPAARLTAGQRAVIEVLARVSEAGVAASRLAADTGTARPALRRLEARGLVALEARVVRRAPVTPAVGRAGEAPVLNDAQRAALTAIEGALASGDDGGFLLHGVTGSGKTEVYLGAAAAALDAGRGVIVLVPEIALTPQTMTRFARRFGDRVAILHSKMSAGERFDEWTRLREGEASVCVGPRSAIFAPVRDLGLIVVDEEHDPSYKQDGDPRYDARAVAARRAKLEGAVLVAGSATPRPESWLEWPHLDLPERVDSRPLPAVELLDMNGVDGSLHPATAAALAGVANRGEKAIVLLNRRGWSNFVSCRGCGHVWRCPNCDVTLVLHMAGGAISCHHCGHREPTPHACDRCGSLSVARHGVGTERLAAELDEIFAGVGDGFGVFRLDTDAVAGGVDIAALLGRFESAPAGVLVGTQMVAKGHDFPDVTLAVVVDADATLRFPDFRAEERAFALVSQLAGRSGRGPAGGRVIVQTGAPETRALRFAADHDAAGFVADELARRRRYGYPPFARLIRVICAADSAAAAEAVAHDLAAAIDPRAGVPLGPAPLFKLKGRERFVLELKAPDPDAGVTAVRDAVRAVTASRSSRGVALSIDVDAQ